MTEISDKGETHDGREQRRQDAMRAHDSISRYIEARNVSAVDSSHHAIKGALLINGGAAVAVLAFISSVVSGENPARVPADQVLNTMFYFVWGVALAAGSGGLAYLTNLFHSWHASSLTPTWESPFFEDETVKTKILAYSSTAFQVAALSCVVVSYILFCAGCYSFKDFVRPALERPTLPSSVAPSNLKS